MLFDIALHEFVFPIVFLGGWGQEQTFLDIFIDQIYFAFFFWGQTYDGSCVHRDLFLDDAEVEITGAGSHLAVNFFDFQ